MGKRGCKAVARGFATGFASIVFAMPALAQSISPAQGLVQDRFVISGGVFVNTTDVTAELDGHSTANPEVDFDQTFGKASDSNRGRIDALWRISPRHHLRYLYFNNSNTRNRVLDRDIHWGDLIYRAGADVSSQTKLTIHELAYEFAFLHEPTYEVSATFGVHYTDLSLQLSGTASITDPSGNVTSTGFVSKTSSLPAPLPVIGVRGGWAVAPQWYLEAQAQLFKYKTDGYDGNWWDTKISGTWMFSRNFGLGLGYNRFTSRVDVDREDFHGNLKLGYDGFQAFLTASF